MIREQTCLYCGAKFLDSKGHTKRVYCSRRCKGRVPMPAGSRYGRWVVLGRAPDSPAGRDRVRCHCDCGSERTVDSKSLREGRTHSCGCIAREKATKHGHSAPHVTPEYRSWTGMLDRCHNPKSKHYRSWGGRGIQVCERWRGPDGYANFYADMGPKPVDTFPSGHPVYSIDRINNDGDYEPGNCRWATAKQQAEHCRPAPKRGSVTHGTVNGYCYWACRCPECTAAMTQYRRKYVALRRLKELAS